MRLQYDLTQWHHRSKYRVFGPFDIDIERFRCGFRPRPVSNSERSVQEIQYRLNWFGQEYEEANLCRPFERPARLNASETLCVPARTSRILHQGFLLGQFLVQYFDCSRSLQSITAEVFAQLHYGRIPSADQVRFLGRIERTISVQ